MVYFPLLPLTAYLNPSMSFDDRGDPSPLRRPTQPCHQVLQQRPLRLSFLRADYCIVNKFVRQRLVDMAVIPAYCVFYVSASVYVDAIVEKRMINRIDP